MKYIIATADADAISRLFFFDTPGDIHLLEEGTPCRPMDKGLEMSLIRKMIVDKEFLDPGRDLDPPPLLPAKTHRGYFPPCNPDPATDSNDLLCQFVFGFKRRPRFYHPPHISPTEPSGL